MPRFFSVFYAPEDTEGGSASVYPATMDTSASNTGGFQAEITSLSDNFPIENATIDIATVENPSRILEEVKTSSSGLTPLIYLPAPPLEYSMTPSEIRPYSEYVLNISAPGYEPIQINGAEILAGVVAKQSASLLPQSPNMPDSAEEFIIPDHTLYGEYPPKIVEEEVKDVASLGEIVLQSVVIPEFIVVHDGLPSNSNAKNYYVRYRDYIKNVASSEIYATWPESTIYANILAIQSFTLNRVYTEWYRSKGYNFTITSSTAYDHKWIPERNIFDTIDTAVDNIFNNYLSRPNVKQPILTQYCDGKRVSCPGLMSQWGSKYLGDDGYTSIEILRNFYGNDMYINSTEEVSGVPLSFPGYTLSIGSSGEAVRTIQEQLNIISDAYPLIPKIAEDGIYGPATAEAVRTFQEIFGYPETGTVDFNTWYRISAIYVGVSRIGEYS